MEKCLEAMGNDTRKEGKDVKKRVQSGKRLSVAAVHFPDWRITNGHNQTTQLVVSYQDGKKVSKLREPRSLYTIANKHYNSKIINIPRWPAEVKVLYDCPQHSPYHPSEPEVFHNSVFTKDNTENFPLLTKAEDGKLVYENSIGNSKYFDRSRVGGSPVKTKFKPLETIDSNTLYFESRFESGNLQKAIKVRPCDYQLWLRTDLYTNKYTQWYYFRVENMQPDKAYRFTIMNLMKSSSLYSNGMKPLMYSEREAKETGIGWRRVGTSIRYYKNELKREDVKGDHYLYSLSWTVIFPHAADRCYFAHCYPYTYTDLQEYLRRLSKDASRSQYCKQRLLTRTLAGNFVYIITITSPSKCPTDAKNKRAVVVSARVHPGETNSSWMMKGLLDYLTSDKPDAKLLRDTFVFKIIPMLNPDGVIVGNYRCSLSGRDLNRNYKTALKEAFPSVWHTREMIKRLSEEREITLYCDLHGHSREQNVFIYGCEDRRNLANGFKERVFPMMMSKNCKDKSGTGRVVMWNMGIKNSYTMEATFCGSTLGSRSGHHFTTADFESMGYHLCDTLLDYCDPDLSKYTSILKELETYVKALVLERMKEKGVAKPDMDLTDVDLNQDYISESSTSGSDSSVSDGLPMHVLYSPPENMTKKKKKKLKTRKERNKRRARTLNKEIKENEERRPSTPIENNSQSKHNSLPTPYELSFEPRKTSRPPSRQTPQRPNEVKRNAIAHQFNDLKIRRYLESMNKACSKNKMPISTHGMGMPQLRYTAGRTCFGLAPAAYGHSLDRWSVRRYRTTGDATDEEDGNFIGRYMARQIHLSQAVRKDDGELKKDKTELLRKIQLYNDSLKTVAGAQSHHKNHGKDSEEHRGKKGPMDKYCPHHAAMLRKARGQTQKETNDAKYIYLHLNEGSGTSPSVEQLSSSNEKTSHTNVSELSASSTRVMAGEKVDHRKGDEERQSRFIQGRRKSESSFSVLQENEEKFSHREKKPNFTGVTQFANNSNRDSCYRRHSTSNANAHPSISIKYPKREARSVSEGETIPLEATSSSTSKDSFSLLEDEERMQQKLTKYPSGSKSFPPGIANPADSSLVAPVVSTQKGTSLKAVERLREKLQNLNTPGRMVTFALNGQLNDVEEDN